MASVLALLETEAVGEASTAGGWEAIRESTPWDDPERAGFRTSDRQL